jgi:hypothetical protein
MKLAEMMRGAQDSEDAVVIESVRLYEAALSRGDYVMAILNGNIALAAFEASEARRVKSGLPDA